MNDTTKDYGTQDALRLFVYGTLKRGYWNHDKFYKGALCIEEAKVRGCLYQLPSGIPILRVPDSDILAVGTSDPLADVATQERFSGQLPADIACNGTNWQMIHGELVVFPNPQLALPPIDRLEGFQSEQFGLYVRALVPVVTASQNAITAWCYIAPLRALSSATATNKCWWP